MSKDKTKDGGIEDARGNEIERYNLLLYMLVRRIEHPDLEMFPQSNEDEDAKFIYTITKDGASRRITEFVQSKKREVASQYSIDENDGAGSAPAEGRKVGVGDLREWVMDKHPPATVNTLLKNDDVYYTALISGGLKDGLKSFRGPTGDSIFNEGAWFKVDFKHEQDPLIKAKTTLQKDFGTSDMRRKLRVVRLRTYPDIMADCRMVLELPPYDVPPSRSHLVLNALYMLLRDYLVKRGDEKVRQIPAGEVKRILIEGRRKQGNWIEAQSFLEKNNVTPADPLKWEQPRWNDFEAGRYAQRDEFQEAVEELENEKFIVISGRGGSGKTTMCRYLAYQFLRDKPERNAFYLSVRSSELLETEREFFTATAQNESLFIVDDEEYNRTEVEKLIADFLHVRVGSKLRLIVTTSEKFSQAQSEVAGASSLNKASQISLSTSTSAVATILKQLEPILPAAPTLQLGDFAKYSHGDLRLSLLLLRYSQQLPDDLSFDRLSEHGYLVNKLSNWILTRTGSTGGQDYFREKIAPVFIIGSLGLPVPENFNEAVEPLLRENFLENNGLLSIGDNTASLQPTNFRLASIISNQYREQHFEVLSNYLFDGKTRELLPLVCSRLARQEKQRPSPAKKREVEDRDQEYALLKELLLFHHSYIIDVITNHNKPWRNQDENWLDLDGITKILNASKKVQGEHERNDLLEALMLRQPVRDNNDREKPLNSFFFRIVTEKLQGSAALRNFLTAVHNIDKTLPRRQAEEFLDPEVFNPLPESSREKKDWQKICNYFQQTLEKEPCRWDTAASCLHAFNYWSRNFAAEMYGRLRESEKFQNHRPEDLGTWVRFCRELRYVNHEESYQYLRQHVTEGRVLDNVLEAERLSHVSTLLTTLHKLSPRLTANVSARLLSDHLDWLEGKVLQEDNLALVRVNLRTLSRLSRQGAARLTVHIMNSLCHLLTQEESYKAVSAILSTLRKFISFRLAQEAATCINLKKVLSSLQQDTSSLDSVGKSFHSIWLVNEDAAHRLMESFDYAQSVRAAGRKPTFRDLCYLIHGVLKAVRPSKQNELLDKILYDSSLSEKLHERWDAGLLLSEIALGLSLLREASLSNKDILRLLYFEDREQFEDSVYAKLQGDTSVQHIANGLYGIAKFDSSMGITALRHYVERLDTANVSKHFKIGKFADIGRLFQVAAAIKPSLGRQLAEMAADQRVFSRLIRYQSDEPNLGRLAIFISGLHKASRKYANMFIDQINTEANWNKQFVEIEEIDNVLHYMRTLTYVNRKKGGEYVRHVIERHGAHLRAALKEEVNLMAVSNWLRVLPSRDEAFVKEHVEEVSEALQATAEFDTRLRHLLEATEAMLECGNNTLAAEFAQQALRQKAQMGSVRRLHDWIILFHKATYIGSRLQMPDFPDQLFSRIDDDYFLDTIFGKESQPLIKAYAYYLLTKPNGIKSETIRRTIALQQHDLIDFTLNENNERRPMLRILALILAEAPLEKIREVADRIEKLKAQNLSVVAYEPWESGLIALIFAHVFPNEDVLLVSPLESSAALQEIINTEVTEHTGNLEYWLALHFAALSGQKHQAEKLVGTLPERFEEEMLKPVQWLLRQSPLHKVTNIPLTYYVWSYLKNTVLRPIYLTWDSELKDANDSNRFPQAAVLDVEGGLSYESNVGY